MILRIATTVIVVWGVWIVQTDSFPITQGFRPSWYVYGWPLCFATSGRGRFNFTSFNLLSLAIDLMVAFLMISGAMVTARRITVAYPRYSIADFAATTAGFAFLLVAASGTYVAILESLSHTTPAKDFSAMAGDIRLWHKTIMKLPLSIGAFSIGFALTHAIIWCTNKPHSSQTHS